MWITVNNGHKGERNNRNVIAREVPRRFPRESNGSIVGARLERRAPVPDGSAAPSLSFHFSSKVMCALLIFCLTAKSINDQYSPIFCSHLFKKEVCCKSRATRCICSFITERRLKERRLLDKEDKRGEE